MSSIRTRSSVLVILLGAALVAILGIVAVRASQLHSRQVDAESASDSLVDDGAVERLAGALRYRTVTKRDPGDLDTEAYEDLFAYLETAFPAVHEELEVETVNEHSRLFTWTGRDSSLAPIVLMAHVDVVPVADEEGWSHDPFGGAVSDGFVWGRGALDDKASAVGILEAVETLLESGYRPNRTVYVALGHDEEVGGQNGARKLAERITADGTRPAMVLDEGGAITEGALPGLERPLAVVGVAEKGYLSVELSAEGPGGHSSVPPETTSIGTVSEAVQKLRNRPMPARLDGVTGQTFRYLAPEMGWVTRAAFANLWLFEPVLTWVLGRNPTTDAAIRTTTAPTRLDAGVKDNVVPTTARAVVNFRILPSQSVADVLDHVRSTLEGMDVSVDVIQENEPTTVSRIDDGWFDVVQRAVREVTPEPIVVAPYLVPGTTDSRYYADHSDHVFRFAPFWLTPDDRERIHGRNERIGVDDYRRMVAFYATIVRRADEVE